MKEKLVKFEDIKKRLLKDPEFKKGYDELEPEFRIISAMIEERIKNEITQKQLAEKLQTKQSAISRFESGTYNPTIAFLKKIAAALNKKLVISIE